MGWAGGKFSGPRNLGFSIDSPLIVLTTDLTIQSSPLNMPHFRTERENINTLKEERNTLVQNL